ncbi:hypothetical protein GCM10023075_50960 [Streptosporangium album]
MLAALAGVLVLAVLIGGTVVFARRFVPAPQEEGTGGADTSFTTSDPAPGQTGEPRETAYINDVMPGTCVDDVFDKTVGDVFLAECTDAHEGEVLARFDLPSGRWPGQKRVDSLAEEGCDRRLAPLFERSPIKDRLSSMPVIPAREDWPGDRLVICVAVHKATRSLLFRAVNP